MLRLSDASGLQSKHGKRDLWDCIEEDFSPRKLTIQSDRLAALAGLVAKLRNDGTYTGRFAAGCWESHLDAQLCWTVSPSAHLRNNDFRSNLEISTWSWAHWNLHVEMLLPSMGISCLQRPARFCFANSEEESQSLRPGPLLPRCRIILHGYIQKVGELATSLDSGPHWTPGQPHAGLPGSESRWHFDSQMTGPGPHYCLRIRDRAESGYDEGSSIRYLVLEEVESQRSEDDTGISVPTIFTRIGMLILRNMSREHFRQPYPKVHFINRRLLLSDGRWQDVILQ